MTLQRRVSDTVSPTNAQDTVWWEALRQLVGKYIGLRDH